MKEPSRFDILRKDIWVWKQMHLHRAYIYLKSDDFKQQVTSLKSFLRR